MNRPGRKSYKKSRNTLKVILEIFVLITLISCNKKSELPHEKSSTALKEALVKANQQLLRKENDQIEALILRYGWKMEKTGSGLRYMIVEQGRGLKPGKGMTVMAEYEIRLIDGSLIYSSNETGMLSFEIAKGQTISGLEEGILLMRVGSRAKFIIPSHLAFGLLGDGNKIPSKAVLIYDVYLKQLK